MLKFIFYLPVILALMWEVANITEPKKVAAFITRLKATQPDNYNSSQKVYNILVIGYFLWLLIGLFSSQWVMFVFIFVISFIPKKFIEIRWLDAVMTTIALVFIIINAFHLHICLFCLLKSWL